MKNSHRSALISGIMLATIIFDQLTKLIAIRELKFSPPIEYLNGLFVLKYAENTGAMLGFGSSLPEGLRFWFLTVFVGILLLALIIYLFLHRDFTRSQTIALSLISGGGISNFIDRALNEGRVVDFMHIDTGYGWLKTGIFNFADVAIMVGLGIMIVFGEWRKHPPEGSEAGKTASPPPLRADEKGPPRPA